MRGISIAVCVAVVFTVAAGNNHPKELNDHQKELKEHYDHLAYIAEFSCHQPQPRLFSVHDLFSEEETSIKAYFPDVTVLHRCDSYVGCCPSNQICKPKTIVPVQLPFKLTFLKDVERHKRGSWIMEHYSIDNHTECACEEVLQELPYY